MDPSIMKFLEEDEDETMHSGADVEAFTAALNRDIEGDNNNNNTTNNNNNLNSTNTNNNDHTNDTNMNSNNNNDSNKNNTNTNMNNNNNNTSAPQLPTSKDSATVLSQGTNHTPSQLFQQLQSSISEVKVCFPEEEDVKPKIHELKSSAMEVNQHAYSPKIQHPPNDISCNISHIKSEPSRPLDDQRNAHMFRAMNMQSTDKNPAQNIAQNPDNEALLQRMRIQQVVAAGQATNNAMNRPSGKQVAFARLLPVIEPQLDKDKAMQLHGLYARLRNNNINKEEFVRHMRAFVGDRMLKMAVYKLQQGQSISSKLEVKVSFPSEEDVKSKIHELKSSTMEVNQHASSPETQHLPSDTSRNISHVKSEPSRPQDDQRNAHISRVMNMQSTDKNPAQSIAQNPDNEALLQRMRIQQVVAAGQATNNAMNRPSGKQVPFARLLPVIEPQLDKDKAMQLHGLYARLRNNNINKEEFVRHMRAFVGDRMLKMAVYKLQQVQIPAQYSAKIGTQKPSLFVGSSPMHQASDSSSQAMDSNAQKARLMEHQSDSHGVQASHIISNVNAMKQEREQPPFPMQGLGKQQQQHMHFPQSSFPTYGNTSGNYHPGSNPNMNMPSQSLQMRQGPVHPTMGSQPMNPMSLPDMKRMHAGGLTHFTSNSPNSGHWQPSMHKDQSVMSSMAYAKPDSVDQMNDQQHKSQLSTPQGPSSFSPSQHEHGSGVAGSSKDDSLEMMSSRTGFSTPMNKLEPKSITAQLERQNAAAVNSSLGPGSNVKTPPKKPVVGQKKPLEAPVNSLSKKQKVSGAFSDQSIEQLNDVTAVSGVNLKEEEEQLFSGSKEDSRVSEASRKVVQEEEDRLILQKSPLQKKLAEIMAKCGVKSRSNDVERCLSLCVEERLRGLISNLIRLSKQRVDIEKPRYRTVITSDVRQQIMSMNQKAREEWEKKQADAEKLQRADEPEGSGDGDDGRGKFSKVNKEEDDKMRTTAANVAARAAVGGDDMLSKWQLMAEQARQKREGGPDAPSTSQPSVEVGPKPVLNSERSSKDNPDAERSSTAVTATPGVTGSVKKLSRNQDLVQSNSNIVRTITVKDIISVLGREVQMSRSTLIYRLYEKLHSDSVSE